MALLSNLTFNAADPKDVRVRGIVSMRQKLLDRIDDQIGLAKAREAGQPFQRIKYRRTRDLESDEVSETTVRTRVRPWWVQDKDGSVLLCRTRQRRRYSIGHELGHFLIPTHMPKPGQGFECSLEDFHLLDPRERDRRKRVEAEANRFAAALLMPTQRIRSSAASRDPTLAEILRLAGEFDVSKEAMARAYVEAHREPIAVVILRHGRIQRIYRDETDFPWLAPRIGQAVPNGSMANAHRLQVAETAGPEECEPEVWFNERDARRVELLTEQLLGQRDGFAMLLLHAELTDDDD